MPKVIGDLDATGLVDADKGFRHGDTDKPIWIAGAGSPEGVVTAPVGSMYSRTDGGRRIAIYRKIADTGNTGWLDETQAYVGTAAPPGTPALGDVWFDSDEDAGIGATLPLSVANGGTGSATAGAARTALGVPGLPVTLAQGGTGATDAAAARTALAVPQVGQSGSTAGAPTTGTWSRGDTFLDSNDVLWVCRVSGTPGTWKSMNQGEELAYNISAGNVSLTSTTPTLVIEGTTRNYDGSPIIAEFFCWNTNTAAANTATYLVLYDGGTSVGYLYAMNGNASIISAGVGARVKVTPSAGSHNYRVQGYLSVAGTATVAGPSSLRITRA